MIQCRPNTFETNSSSMHSLVVMKQPKQQEGKDYFWLNNDNLLYTWEELYFGRAPFKILYSTKDKIWYAFANFYPMRNASDKLSKRYDELVKAVMEIVEDCAGIKEPSKGDTVGTDDYLLDAWLNKLNISVKEFLTNPKYVVVCDGDEYCIWEDLKEQDLINKENIEMEIRYYYED